MTSTFARLVKKQVDRGRFTVTELCDDDLADCSERHFYNWLNGEAHLPDYKVELLANYFAKHGVTQPSSAFFTPEFVLIRRVYGRADGSIKQDIVDCVHALSEIDHRYSRKDRDEARQTLDVLRQKLADFEAKLDLLPE